MPNLLYKTVAPVVTFFTSGPTAETSPAKINHREVSHPSIDARAGSMYRVLASRAQTLKPPPRVPREGKGCIARRSFHAPLVGLRCALSVSTIPPLVTASAAATLTRTPAPHGTTEVYWAGTSNGAAARVVVDVARRALETRRAMREFRAGAARA